MKIFIPLFLALLLPTYALSKTATPDVSPQEAVRLGQRIYEVRGANTCVMCHGTGGYGGSYAQAAKLNEPRTWKLYAVLGGTHALQKEPIEFLARMEKAHVELILTGATQYNQTHHTDLDPMMYGILQAPTLREIDKIREELTKQNAHVYSKEEIRQLAAFWVYQYVKTLDTAGPKGGVFVQSNRPQKNR